MPIGIFESGASVFYPAYWRNVFLRNLHRYLPENTASRVAVGTSNL